MFKLMLVFALSKCKLVCQSVSRKEGKKQYSTEPSASLAETAWCSSWSPFYMSFLYFLHIGLPGALKPDERDHRNSGFSIPACCSEGLCILPLFWGKRVLILSKKSGKFRLLPNIVHRCLLMCLSAGDELVLVRMIHVWPVRVIQDHPGCMRGKG